MSHKTDATFYWDDQMGVCRCCLRYRNDKYLGFAYVHPLDADMISEKVGQEIAYNRAMINALKDQKKNLKLELKGLNSLYYSMKHSPHFNTKSYEAKMLYRQIKMRMDDIESIDEAIQNIENYLKGYIDRKDALYQKIRLNRNKGNVLQVKSE